MKYRIVKKHDYHFELQIRDMFIWRTREVHGSLASAQNSVQTTQLYAAPGVVVETGRLS